MAHSLFADERSIFEFMVAQSGQTCPGNVGLDTLFQGVEPDALHLQGVRQLFRLNSYSRAHVSEGFIDLSICQIDTRPLSLLDLVHVVGQLADYILPNGLFVAS